MFGFKSVVSNRYAVA